MADVEKRINLRDYCTVRARQFSRSPYKLLNVVDSSFNFNVPWHSVVSEQGAMTIFPLCESSDSETSRVREF